MQSEDSLCNFRGYISFRSVDIWSDIREALERNAKLGLDGGFVEKNTQICFPYRS